MNTYAIQLLLHYQSASNQESRFNGFLADLKILAERHGISLDDFQSFGLPGAEYRIEPCARCKQLTVEAACVRNNIENMLPDFWHYVRRGIDSGDSLLCELCAPTIS